MKALRVALVLATLATGCVSGDELRPRSIAVSSYENKVYGAWMATMVANQSGLDLQGIWIDEAGDDGEFSLEFPDQWSTDDDTHVEWLDLHILETHGLDPTPEQIRDEWVDHLNNDIWVSARRARDLMDEGFVPPDTGSAENNPEGVWSIGAQLTTELFGLMAPGLPDTARAEAIRFGRVTNSGLAVDVAGFYAHLYSEAFFQSDIDWLFDRALLAEPEGSEVAVIVETVRQWHREHRDDWRVTRRLIRDRYDVDPEWWASKVNFAATIMALLYGEGDMEATLELAGLAGWDADNNMTSAAGLLGVISGFDGLPDRFQNATDVYFNQDLTGDLPQFDTVSNISARTSALGAQVLGEQGVEVRNGRYKIPAT